MIAAASLCKGLGIVAALPSCHRAGWYILVAQDTFQSCCGRFRHCLLPLWVLLVYARTLIKTTQADKKLFSYAEIQGVRYPRLVLEWFDITGESGWVDEEEFKSTTCSKMVTEGFLFDVFSPAMPSSPQKFVRTFASYELAEGTFGDRNVFPLGALSPESQDLVASALLFMCER